MIHTVFSSTPAPEMQAKAELLEYSWRRVKQPGELVRLVASLPGASLPRHRYARVFATLAWSPHPYTGDEFAGYDLAASVLEWLFRERPDGTILLLDADCILLRPVAAEAVPGEALAAPPAEIAQPGDGPFGLGSEFSFLHRFCVDRSLEISQVALPILVHSRDLRRMAARWLELTGLIRSELLATSDGRAAMADRIAYAIAAAEAEVPHVVGDLGADSAGAGPRASIVRHRGAAELDGEKAAGRADSGLKTDPANRGAGLGEALIRLFDEHARWKALGGGLTAVHPRRRAGIRETRVLDRMLLEIPGRQHLLDLNTSAAAIWELCRDDRSLAEIARALCERFDRPFDALLADVEAAAEDLRAAGGLDLCLDEDGAAASGSQPSTRAFGGVSAPGHAGSRIEVPTERFRATLDYGHQPADEAALRRAAEPFRESHRRAAASRRAALSELCAGLAAGPLIVTTFNLGFASLFENWVASCDAREIDVRSRTIVFAIDGAAHALARARGFRSYFEAGSYGEQSAERAGCYGDERYRELMFVKTAAVMDAIDTGRDLLFQDIDLVWLRDPLPGLVASARDRRLDFLFMHDGPNARFQPTYFNTGFFFVRNNEWSRAAWAAVLDNFHWVLAYAQQCVVNVVMSYCQQHGLRAARLGDEVHVNGHVLKGIGGGTGTVPAAAEVVHASWTQDLEEKRRVLEEHGLWFA